MKDNVEAIYPLSPMQQGLLFHTVYAPETGVYIGQMACRLDGSVDADALEKAWHRLLARHSALRSAFVWKRVEDPRQVVHQRVSLTLERLDWRDLAPEEQAAKLEAFLYADRVRGFDLGKAPLMRTALIQVQDNAHYFVWTQHHLIIDGWCLHLLLEEGFTFYQGLCRGQEISLSPARPYRDYIAWLQKQNLGDAEAYWRRTLKGFTAPTALPIDRPLRDASAKPDIREQRLELTSETGLAIHRFARENQLTVNTIVQGVWSILLSRYSRERDVLFGMVVSGRPPDLAGAETMVGLFVNSLPLRVQVHPQEPLVGWFKALQTQQVEMRQYEYSPLVDVHSWSDVPRGLPMFDSILAYQNYPPIESLESRLQGLKISDLRVSDQTSFPLLLQATGNGNALSLRFSYDANRFADDAIERMIGHLRTLMESLPAYSKKRVGDLPMLTPVEIESFLRRWNGPQATVPQSRCLHQRFEEHAERTPDAIAVTCEGQQLTYGELNRQANRLAHYLTAKGVGPEVVVGICTDRSIPMIVAVLAILKAGGIYLPLDPDYPQARIEFMLEDSGAPLLLTQQELLPRFSEHKPEVLCIDTDWDRIAQEPLTNLECRTVVENTAYIIYTSGSTGKPKGTSITHANVGRLFDTTQPWFHFDVSDVWTMFHSLAFDFSVWEVWGALLFGGRLVIVPYFVSRSPEAFYDLLRDQQVTVLNQTPSAFRQFVQIEENVDSGPLALRYVIFGGEALDIKSLSPWFARHGDKQPQLVNMYGITETTVHVTYRPLTQADAVAAFGRSVIGRPIPDLRIYLLDEQLQGVPVGIAGELHVGGSGLSRGYLGRPELTADRFIPDPFSSVPGARLYKSGDLACRLPDGDIEYLGRIDQQVKVRGFRIEPAEIEAILASHPAVRQAVVMLRGDGAAASLVGYVVARDGETASLAEPASCEGERTALWQTVFDETYRQGVLQEDPTFNITGWNSSYTGLPIPSEEMRSWVDETVDQIRGLQPNRVLEIGCGTGLLLLRLAPQCAQYVATDFSQVSLDYVSQHASALGVSNLTLYRRMADDFEGIEENFFDTVILNSVVQYFPSIDYLVRVLEGAVRCVKPGGNIFVGDLRNLRLLEAFHTSIELEHAGASLGRRGLQDQVRRRIAQEEELVIDPAFFAALKQHLHKIGDVDVRLKRGRYINELTQFRYDVVLQVGDESQRERASASVEWRSLDDLQEVLSREESVEVRQIPNARVFAATKAVELLSQHDGPDTAGALRQTLQSINNEAVDPAHLIALGEELGCSVSLTWSAASRDGSFDVILGRCHKHRNSSFGVYATVPEFPSQYANNPLRGILGQKLVPELRRHLRSHVPEYMVPASFVVLDSMPLTRNGKIDRAALPLPSGERPKLDVPYVPPTTETEKELARIWVDVLGVDRIGIHDNFFDLGGHSLMVIQLMSRVRKAFQVELPLRDVFTTPTIKEIADMLEARILAKASSEKIDQLLAQLESMDDKKALQMLGSGETKSE